MSHSSLPVALLASHPPCGSLWAAPKAPLGPRFPSGQFAALTRRKKASIAHFDGGARNVARNGVGQLSPAFGVRSCSPFSAAKMGGSFSLHCLSPLCSGAAGVKQAQPTQVGMLHCSLDNFAAQKTVLFFFFCGWHYPYVNSAARDASMCLRYSCNTKRQRIFFIRCPFSEP